MTDLTGRVALITGSAHGIGAACTRHLASVGATVVSTDIDDAAGLSGLAQVGRAGLISTWTLRTRATGSASWKLF